MPASYAHYRFGKLALQALPADVQRHIQRFRRMYDLGLQGPDIFFYYNPFWSTQVGELGHGLHMQSGQEFFSRLALLANSEAGMAYLYGVLAHYCLDSVCHPYINRVTEDGTFRHVPLESEFDRYLLETDGKTAPHSYDISRHIRITRGECVTVAAFYPPATAGSILQSVRYMAGFRKYLAGKNRPLLEKLLKNMSYGLSEHLIPVEVDEKYTRVNSELLARFNQALADYPQRLSQLTALKNSGTPLGEEFAPIFG